MKHNPKHKAAADRKHIQNHRFPRHHFCNMLLFHAENVVNPQLFLAPLHHEAVCVK